ncbi:hypothetical protein C8F04DRAFT_1249222 [Mycena alexandri]|uniref:Uncharacterized protein n=1 Tax=Mycena alexandri TaxID=1745969 RepID=A0AAD6TL58_9AGAR|nr:hypothetical protein C8F04DRAFT_1249222 [Mycena alexandri]
MTNGPPASAAGPSSTRPVVPQASRGPPGIPPQLPQGGVNPPYFLSQAPLSREAPRPQPHYLQPVQPQWAPSWSTSYSSSLSASTPPPPQSTYRNSGGPPQFPPILPQPQNNGNNNNSYAPQRARFTEPYPHTKVVHQQQSRQPLSTAPVVPSQPPPPPLAAHAPAPPPLLPPPPPPPPPKFKHWDSIIKEFLVKLNLKQAVNGFEADILVMNPDFERATVPGALLDLLQGIIVIQQGIDRPSPPEKDRPLEERKLDYVHTKNPASQTSITKSISAFLAQNRAKNDASNRAEFLHSLAEKKRKRAAEDEGDGARPNSADVEMKEDPPSCARTDAKPIDRDTQMKYDIAKNHDGPLRRTTRQKTKPVVPPTPSAAAPAASPTASTRTKTKQQQQQLKKSASPAIVKAEPDLSAGAKAASVHFALDQRVGNIESHFSVRYVPGPPDTLLARLAHLEEHIMRLEKDYPPWAALHFNQPNRGWPPPPRATPIIVPPAQRSFSTNTASLPKVVSVGGVNVNVKTKNTGSSLQRAVMDKLAVNEARADLAGQR